MTQRKHKKKDGSAKKRKEKWSEKGKKKISKTVGNLELIRESVPIIYHSKKITQLPSIQRAECYENGS